MKLTLGTFYTFLKTDGTTVTFKFIGGEKACGEIDGQSIEIYTILNAGYLSYWEN